MSFPQTQQTGSPQGGGLAQQIPQLYNAASGGAASASNPFLAPAAAMTAASGGPAQPGMSTYMNPYTQEVIDASMGDIQRQLGINLNNIQGQSASANAFGARGELERSEAIKHALDAQARTGAALRAGSWDNALGASQNDLARLGAAGGQLGQMGEGSVRDQLARAMALSSLTGQGYDMYTGLAGQQYQMGQQERGAQQQAYDTAMQEYLRQIQYPWQAVGMQLPGIQPSSTSKTSGGSPGLLDILGTGAQVAGAIAGF